MNQRKIGIVISYWNTILSTVIGFVLSVFLLQKMGATEYGVYQTMSAFANYLVLLQFGVGTVMTRNIAQCRARGDDNDAINKQFVSIFSFAIILSITILLVSILFYINIGRIYENSLTVEEILYGKKIFLFVTCYLVFSFLTESFNGVIQGFEHFTFSKASALVKLVLRTAIVFLVFIWSPQAVTLAIIDLIVSFIYAVINAIYCRIKFDIKISLRYFDKSIIIGIMPYALALLIQSVVNQANNNVDKFLIGIMMNPVSVTISSIGLFIYSSYSSMAIIPISLYLPKIVMDVENGISNKKLAESLVEPSRLITLIGGAILFAFFSIGKKFIFLFYGSEYMEAYYVALVIMIPMFLNMSTGILINVLDAKGKRLSRSLIILGTTIANIILTVFFIQLWGVVGAAIATAICTFLGQVVIMNIYYKKEMHIDVLYLYKTSYKGLLLSMTICAIILYPISLYLPSAIWAFIVECLLFAILLFVCLSLFGLNDGEKKAVKFSGKKVFDKIVKRG